MIKYIVVVFLNFIVFKIICEEICPLQDVEQLQHISKLNGVWQEYKKTKNFLSEEECVSYNVKNCSKDIECYVEVFHNDKIVNTTVLVKKDDHFLWGDEKEIYISLDGTVDYALVWACSDTKEKQTVYDLAVLMTNVSDEDSLKIVDEKLKTLKVNYTIDLATTDYSTCGSCRITAISLVSIFAVMFILIN